MQRIFKYSDTQYTSLTPDKILNSLIYRTLFYVNIYGSHKLLKTVQFFGPTLYFFIDFLYQELNPGSVTHPSTNQAWHRVTLLIIDQRATTMLNRHTMVMMMMYLLQVTFVREERDRPNEEVLGECLQHRIWVQRVSYTTFATLTGVTTTALFGKDPIRFDVLLIRFTAALLICCVACRPLI